MAGSQGAAPAVVSAGDPRLEAAQGSQGVVGEAL